MTISTYRWPTPAALADWRLEERPDTPVALRSPAAALPSDCTEIVPSWRAETPPGTAVEIRLRARYGQRWTKEYRLATWDSALVGSRRTSFDSQRDDDGYVCTDTLVLRPGAEAVEALVVCLGSAGAQPALRSFTLTCSGATGDAPRPGGGCAPCGLATPCYSQFTYASEDGWCSPTSLAMVLGYWHDRTKWQELAPFAKPDAVPDLVAPGVYDPAYDGYGNWSFNVAFAAARGLDSYVARMGGLAEVEPWLQAGVPVVLSVAWKEGELTGAPLPRSRGHLLVATGFTPEGDVIVADPAGASSAEVRRSYLRSEFERCWLRPYGTAYLIYPAPWPVPAKLRIPYLKEGKKLLAHLATM